MRWNPLFVLLFATCLTTPSAAAQDSNWSQFLGPNRNGTSEETGLVRSFGPEGPKVQWTIELGPGYGGAAVENGKVYIHDRILSDGDVLRVLDLETGEEEWRFENEAPGRLQFAGSRCVPTLTEEFIYLMGGFGHVICLDREMQEEVWRVELIEDYESGDPGYGFCQAPLIHEDLVIVAPMTEEIGLLALDRFTGDEVWTSEGLGFSHSTPLLYELNGQLQVIFLSSKRIEFSGQSFRVSDLARPQDQNQNTASGLPPVTTYLTSFTPDGDQLWQTEIFTAPYPITVPVQVDESHLFMTNGYLAGSSLLEIKEKDGETVVKELFHHDKGSQIHVPMLVDDHFYVLANENDNDPRPRRRFGGLMCLDMEGNEKWRTGDQPYFGRGSMLLADGMLIIQDGHNGTLRLVEPTPEEYRPIAEANLFGIDDRKDHQMWAPMALSDGRLLVRSQEELKCVDLRAAAD